MFMRAALSALLIIGLVLSSGCNNDGASEKLDNEAVTATIVPVRVTPVIADKAPDTLRFAGVAMAAQRANLTFQVGGVLNRGELLVGQPVEQGAVLASVYNPELQPALASARARLNELRSQSEQATRETARADTLYQRGVISAQQREQLESTAASLRAALANAHAGLRQRQQLAAEAELRAPFAGHIEALPVESGEFVAPGQTVVRLASGEALEMTIQIPAEWAGGLSKGQRIAVWPRVATEPLWAQISELGQGSSLASSLYPVTLRLPEKGIRSGDTLEAELPRTTSASLRVPLSAVVRQANGQAVFRLRDGHAEQLAVQVSAVRGEWVMLVTDDLQAGDQVVYAGLSRLLDGDRVEVLR